MDMVFSPGTKIPDLRSIGSVTVLPNPVELAFFEQFSCEKSKFS